MKTTILSKLLTLMLVLIVVPLVLVAILAAGNARSIGEYAANNAQAMGRDSLTAMDDIGAVATEDSKSALQALAQESIEVRAVDLANRIADFLYERDADTLAARSLDRDAATFQAFLVSKRRPIVLGDQVLVRPLYKEIAFYDPAGNVVLKETISGYDGKEYTLDDFMTPAAELGDGDLYVSHLWGDYLFKSEAYAGVEKPDGKRYEGYYRWVTPVYEGGTLKGYLSLKLDARQVMELAQYFQPTAARFVDHPDAPSGNYAYMVDDEGWLTMHAREYHLKGVLPDGTLPPPLSKDEGDLPILEDTTPLQFGHLGGYSVELDEIHTVHAMKGESGSQIYPWAGLNKWVAYAVIPYRTGANYDDAPIGFGWVAIGAQIDKFNEPADETAAKIAERTEEQASLINAQLDGTGEAINERVDTSVKRNMLLIIVILVIVTLVGTLFANRLSRPIRQLTKAAKKVTEGDFEVKLPNVKGNDEVAELTATMEMLVAGLKARIKKK